MINKCLFTFTLISTYFCIYFNVPQVSNNTTGTTNNTTLPLNGNPWNSISILSSGSTELTNASGGASINSDKNEENLLMTNKRRGTTVNHNKKKKKWKLMVRISLRLKVMEWVV